MCEAVIRMNVLFSTFFSFFYRYLATVRCKKQCSPQCWSAMPVCSSFRTERIECTNIFLSSSQALKLLHRVVWFTALVQILGWTQLDKGKIWSIYTTSARWRMYRRREEKRLHPTLTEENTENRKGKTTQAEACIQRKMYIFMNTKLYTRAPTHIELRLTKPFIIPSTVV